MLPVLWLPRELENRDHLIENCRVFDSRANALDISRRYRNTETKVE